MKPKPLLKSDIAAYFALLALVGLMVIGYFDLLHSGISVPIIYGGDGMMHGIEIKSILDKGWYYFNDNIGAPFGTNLADFPRVEMFHFLQIKFLGYLLEDYGQVLNAFYFSGYLLIALSSYWVMRQLRIGIGLAMAGTILFCFAPYHLARLEHLFLASYFVIPLAVFLALQLNFDRPPFYRKVLFDFRDYRTLFFTLLLGSSGVYYAFYGVILILVAAFSAALNQGSFRPLKSGAMLTVVITGILLINVAPSIYYKTVEGGNPAITTRQFEQSERYALKMTHLLLPSQNHNIESFAKTAERYNQILKPRDFSAPLGLAASMGFLLLLIILIFKVGDSGNRNIRVLSELNLTAFLFGTVGGLGVLFAFFITPSVRAHNRISIFIAFIALCALMIAIQSLVDQDKVRRKFGRWLLLTPVIIVMMGLYDQLPLTKKFANRISSNKVEYQQDRQFVEQIERLVVPGGMIFQMPHIRFPEEPVRWHEGPYGLARGYLHSRQLRWSYGAMKGRDSDALLQTIEALPWVEKLDALEKFGFQGIYIDRRAYRGGAEPIETELNRFITVPPLESDNKHLLFYPLIKQNKSARAVYLPLLFGFHRWEGRYPNNWQWSDGSSEHLIEILSSDRNSNETLTVTFSINSGFEQTVTVSHALKEQNYRIELGKAKQVSLTIEPFKKRYLIKLVSDTPARASGSADPRRLGFSVWSLRIKVLERE